MEESHAFRLLPQCSHALTPTCTTTGQATCKRTMQVVERLNNGWVWCSASLLKPLDARVRCSSFDSSSSGLVDRLEHAHLHCTLPCRPHLEKIHYFMSKADAVDKEHDRQRVLIQITQVREACP